MTSLLGLNRRTVQEEAVDSTHDTLHGAANPFHRNNGHVYTYKDKIYILDIDQEMAEQYPGRHDMRDMQWRPVSPADMLVATDDPDDRVQVEKQEDQPVEVRPQDVGYDFAPAALPKLHSELERSIAEEMDARIVEDGSRSQLPPRYTSITDEEHARSTRDRRRSRSPLRRSPRVRRRRRTPTPPRFSRAALTAATLEAHVRRLTKDPTLDAHPKKVQGMEKTRRNNQRKERARRLREGENLEQINADIAFRRLANGTDGTACAVVLGRSDLGDRMKEYEEPRLRPTKEQGARGKSAKSAKSRKTGQGGMPQSGKQRARKPYIGPGRPFTRHAPAPSAEEASRRKMEAQKKGREQRM